MFAMLLDHPGQALRGAEVPRPEPAPGQLLLRVAACGVCRTDLHITDGELPEHRSPLIPGHQVVGRVVRAGSAVQGFQAGERVGVAWLGGSCGCCHFCLHRQENLCEQACFTGYDVDGGYAEYMAADAAYVFRLPERYDDVHAAPLLCAGLIGYRAYAMAGDAQRIGLYGFGAAAHILAQLAVQEGREVYAFTRPGDTAGQAFARQLGVAWAGGTDQQAPQLLDAALIFAPAGALVPLALAATRKGGSVICAGIHMSEIPAMPYSLLWGERTLRSVANLTREDGEQFFRLAARYPIHTETTVYPLAQANEALAALRAGVQGAVVLVPGAPTVPVQAQ